MGGAAFWATTRPRLPAHDTAHVFVSVICVFYECGCIGGWLGECEGRLVSLSLTYTHTHFLNPIFFTACTAMVMQRQRKEVLPLPHTHTHTRTHAHTHVHARTHTHAHTH